MKNLKSEVRISPKVFAIIVFLCVGTGALAIVSLIFWLSFGRFMYVELTSPEFVENEALIKAVRDSSDDLNAYLKNPAGGELQSLKLCEDAIKRDPRDWTAYRLRAGIYFDLAWQAKRGSDQWHQFVDAGYDDLMVVMVRTPEHPWAFVVAADHAELVGAYDTMAANLRQAVEILPQKTAQDRTHYGRVLESLGRATMNTGERNACVDAIPVLTQAIEVLGDESVNSRLNRGICYFLTGHHEGAIGDYRWIIANASEHPTLVAEAEAGIAEVYIKQKNLEDAQLWIDRALEHDPDNAFAQRLQKEIDEDKN